MRSAAVSWRVHTRIISPLVAARVHGPPPTTAASATRPASITATAARAAAAAHSAVDTAQHAALATCAALTAAGPNRLGVPVF